jgi:drug/metabolite transporter (DMT)-like permease
MYGYGVSFTIGKTEVIKLFFTGSLIAGHWILFFTSARVATASVCLAGMATTSFWTSLLEPLVLKKRIRWFEVFLGIIVIIGLYIIFHFEFNHALGLLLALISAFLAALFTVINSQFAKVQHHHAITFYEMMGACLSIVLFSPFYKMWFAKDHALHLHIAGFDLLYISILALICTVYAYSASIGLMKKISAFSVNLTVNLEPVYGIILAVIIFGEREKMNPGFYIGAAIILFSVLAHPFLNKYYHRKYLEIDNLR